MTPPSGHPGSGSPRARDAHRKSHTSKKGRLVTRYVMTKRGPARRRLREKTLRERYRPVHASEPLRKGSTGLRKGTRYYIPTVRVLEVQVYGLARTRNSDEYDTLDDEDNWTFYFRPRTDPDRVTDIIVKEFHDAGLVLVDDEEKDGGYRPFTVASQVVDRNDVEVIAMAELPGIVRSKIAAMKWTKPGGKRSKK
jgi:hypothetical protein